MSTTRTAIVTGAAQGIGRAIALRLASDGFNLLITDINSEKLVALQDEIVSLGLRSIYITGDISDKLFVQQIIESAVEQFGGVHAVSWLTLLIRFPH